MDKDWKKGKDWKKDWKYWHLHPLLVALLKKLENKNNTTVDARDERLSWVMAGCPVYDTPRGEEHPDTLELRELLERAQ